MRKQSNGHSSLQHTLEQLTAQRSQIDEAIAALEKLQGIDVLPTDTGGAKVIVRSPPLKTARRPPRLKRRARSSPVRRIGVRAGST